MSTHIKDFKKIAASDFAADNGLIWLIHPGLNKLIEINQNSGKGKILYDLCIENSWYQSICKKDDKLLLLPSSAKEIQLYSLKDSKIYSIEFKSPCHKRKIKYDQSMKFWNYTLYEHYVYIGGYTYPSIIRVDLRSMDICYIDGWVEEIDKFAIEREYNGYIGYGSAVIDDHLVFPMACCSALLILDTITLETNVQYINTSEKGFNSLVQDRGDNCLWIETIEGNLLKISYSYIIDKVVRNNESDSSGFYWGNYWQPIVLPDSVLLFPLRAEKAYRIDKKTLAVSEWDDINEAIGPCGIINLHLAKETENSICIINYSDFKWMIINKETHQIDSRQYYEIDNKEIKKKYSEFFKNNVLSEVSSEDLNVFLEII